MFCFRTIQPIIFAVSVGSLCPSTGKPVTLSCLPEMVLSSYLYDTPLFILFRLQPFSSLHDYKWLLYANQTRLWVKFFFFNCQWSMHCTCKPVLKTIPFIPTCQFFFLFWSLACNLFLRFPFTTIVIRISHISSKKFDDSIAEHCTSFASPHM